MSETERAVSSALKTMLVNNEPFQYAHLIKFERPSRPDSGSGLISTSKERYTYLTDASINVSFDDGSTSLDGTSNGTQVYLANKVLSVGSIQEQTKATASTTNVTIDGNSLGAEVLVTVNITAVNSTTWDVAIQSPSSLDELLYEGFREGDKITIGSVAVNINSFRSGNVLRVTKIDTSLTPVTGSIVTIKLASEEIISILLNKNSADYASFINREVFIYRAYFQNGVIVGDPVLLFKGIIQNVSFEDTDSAIRVSWGLNSHWGDFSQVKGRITSDAFHRALNENSIPQPSSAIKSVYAYDKGFMHAETSINILAKYIVQVEKTRIKAKSGFFGLGAKVKVKKYFVPEDRFTDLDFQLNAKAIPVVYGVRLVEGINVFADTLNDNSAVVYVVTALSEGEIGGIYDIFVEGSSLICNDKADEDARGSGIVRSIEEASSIGMTCRGRADRGDALGGTVLVDPNAAYNFYDVNGEQYSITNQTTYNYSGMLGIGSYSTVTVNDILLIQPLYSTYGVLDGETIALNSPQEIQLDVFTGKPGQKASAQLSKIAYDKNFKIQNSYWTGSNTVEYWGPNHRLLDTAYVVGKYIIKEGDTTIPEIKYVIRGKLIDCYNYDYSYLHDSKVSGEQATDYHTNFKLGDYVTLYTGYTTSSVQIIDKFSFKNPDGSDNIRFRFSSPPNLQEDSNGIPTITRFYMRNSGGQNWTMTTYNYLVYGEVPQYVGDTIASTITSVVNSSGVIQVNFSSNSNMTIINDPIESSPFFQIVQSDLSELTSGTLLPYASLAGTAVTSTSLTSAYPYASYADEASTLLTRFPGAKLASKNTVKLDFLASTTDDYYLGNTIEITRYNSSTGKSISQTAEIVGYSGANKIATIDTIWSFIPTSTDSIKIYPKYADSRVSINTAIQALDYITSKTYGRGLDPVKDLKLSSWLETARTCDTRSDVTLLCSSSISFLMPNDVYKYPSSGPIVWQGTVSALPSGNYAKFTNILGKITNKWNSWKTWQVGDVIYNPTTYAFYRVDAAGTITTVPTFTGGTTQDPAGTCTSITHLTSLSITKVYGSGPTSIDLNISAGNPVQDIRKGQKISGYSLYDSDDIDYWRLSGWDEHSQRYVTKYQTNIMIDTATPLFDNMNGILEHMNGILRYSSGRYSLDIEGLQSTAIASNDVRTITSDSIIGKIQLSDEGVRSAFNSLTAAFADPGNKFEARNISFFNSDYLKIDRNLPKKGNLSVPGITNYYNTRLLADGFLNKSRFGLTISMTIRHHGLLLLAGTVIQVVYPRYDWVSPGKKFRIETVTYQPDGLVDIVAKEYDDSFYSLVNVSAASGTGATTLTPNLVMGSPSNLIVTSADSADELLNGVSLIWTNHSSVLNSANVYTEIYASLSNRLYIYVTSINGTTNVLTSSYAHGLSIGMPVYAESTGNGIVSGTVYYVQTVPTATTFTLATDKALTSILDVTTIASTSLKIRTATLLDTVPVPMRTYVDTLVNEGTGRVEKYYWVRHKAIKQ